MNLLNDKDWLCEQFKTKSARKIAEELGVSESKVEYWLTKHGIYNSRVVTEELKERLYDLYLVKRLKQAEIAKELGISESKVRSLLAKCGIKKNGTKDIIIKEDKLKDAEWLREQFNRKTQVEIAEELGVGVGKVMYWLKKHKIKQPFKRPINEDKVSWENPYFCYLAGLIATDGYVDKTIDRVIITQHRDDEYIFDNIRNYFEGGNPTIRSKEGNCSMFSLSSYKLIELLELVGVERFSNKTFEAKVPPTFYNYECLKMYLRGIIDGDGHIHKEDAAISILTGSRQFIEGLADIFKEYFGIDVTVSVRKGKYYSLRVKKCDSLKLLKWIYTGYEDFCLKRKRDRVMSFYGEDIV